MRSWIADWYDWIKALHVISVIAWMAGMLYLPRLFVYHADAPAGSPLSETLQGHGAPAAARDHEPGDDRGLGVRRPDAAGPGLEPGLAAREAAAASPCSPVLHHLMARWRKDFAADRNRRPARFYRIVNEVPAVIMVAIVILVIVKPF